MNCYVFMQNVIDMLFETEKKKMPENDAQQNHLDS